MIQKKIRRFWSSLHFFFFAYPCGCVIGILFVFLRLLGLIHIKNIERFPWKTRNLIIASSHPSSLDPFLIAGLLFSEFLWSPFRYAPYLTPDKLLFDRWFLWLLRPRLIFIPRGKPRELRELVKPLREIECVLRRGGRVVIFPEGGRTARRSEFVFSPSGKRLGKLQSGVARVAVLSGSTIVVLDIRGAEKIQPIGSIFPKFWRCPIEIRIGTSFRVPQARNREEERELRTETLSRLEKEMLGLRDE